MQQHIIKTKEEINSLTESALIDRDFIIGEYWDELNVASRRPYIEVLESLNEETIRIINFKKLNLHSTERLRELTDDVNQLKEKINAIHEMCYNIGEYDEH